MSLSVESKTPHDQLQSFRDLDTTKLKCQQSCTENTTLLYFVIFLPSCEQVIANKLLNGHRYIINYVCVQSQMGHALAQGKRNYDNDMTNSIFSDMSVHIT